MREGAQKRENFQEAAPNQIDGIVVTEEVAGARPDYIESSEGLLRGTWKIEASLEDPEFEPGIFNPGEIVEIQTLLDIPEQGDTIGRIMIVTANGVSAANVVATIEIPRSHQGIFRPDKKN